MTKNNKYLAVYKEVYNSPIRWQLIGIVNKNKISGTLLTDLVSSCHTNCLFGFDSTNKLMLEPTGRTVRYNNNTVYPNKIASTISTHFFDYIWHNYDRLQFKDN